MMASRRPRIAVFGSGSAPPGHPVLAQAEQLGQGLAAGGYILVCGGYGGTMEAASRGARQAGGQVVGVTMDLFAPHLAPNPWLTEEQRVTDFFPRLQRLTDADGFVVLQGGIGTLTEATLTWSLLQTGQISSMPFLFVGAGWRRLFDAFRSETLMTGQDFSLATVVDSVDEALAQLKEIVAPTP
ncbi:LOG family protein [Chloroflexota bacterium]